MIWSIQLLFSNKFKAPKVSFLLLFLTKKIYSFITKLINNAIKPIIRLINIDLIFENYFPAALQTAIYGDIFHTFIKKSVFVTKIVQPFFARV
jgi:hypothetical protein